MIWHFVLAHFAAMASGHIALLVVGVALLLLAAVITLAPALFATRPGTIIGGIATISCLVLWVLLKGQVAELQTEIYNPTTGYKVLIVNRDATIRKQNDQLKAIAAEGAAKLKAAGDKVAEVQSHYDDLQKEIAAIRHSKPKDICGDNIILENDQ